MSDFHSLKVSTIQQLTSSSVAITFAIPDDLKDTFTFSAGQYITISKEINGVEVRRAYSISSVPASGKITVGVKKITDGTFSVYANDNIKVGDVLEVMPPEGRFVFQPSNSAKHVAAFVAGSGITPIMSIAETVLKSHLNSTFVLVYGNQNTEEVMFSKEIEALQKQYNNRFFVQHVFSRINQEGALFGRIEGSTVNYIVKNKFKDTAFDAFYLCGPEEMIDLVSEKLQAANVAKEKIHFELFTSSETVDTMAENLDGATQVQVIVDDETFTFSMDKKMLVLDAVLKENIDAPYSCQGGVCSSCIARVTEGKAEMVKNQILTDGEIAEGLILTCQAHPLTPTLKVDFDDV
ncbi:ferredoxin--NADP reductase [Cellulophaga sp. E16_2]|uniref:Ferredoxin n=1 Tax=Cellulophaga algicola (strain DSM 14237 / IC166 / ACAM 630) TaxID=688270 RepID=E6XB12_CELAD|nr:MULTISPECIES: ferredoxin--NADP reductase [Cellulophaga]ADV48868.1 ferredoxin [Cellulophaga algicola DSM 14237]MBO0591338.1 ferredoxin--NADP reductase [Cellulophaga sp. E16_2]